MEEEEEKKKEEVRWWGGGVGGERNEKRVISRVDESSWTIQYIKASLHA